MVSIALLPVTTRWRTKQTHWQLTLYFVIKMAAYKKKLYLYIVTHNTMVKCLFYYVYFASLGIILNPNQYLIHYEFANVAST